MNKLFALGTTGAAATLLVGLVATFALASEPPETGVAADQVTTSGTIGAEPVKTMDAGSPETSAMTGDTDSDTDSDAGDDNGNDNAGTNDGNGNAHEVSITTDTGDADPGDGRCADDSGACSLRAAVQEANAASGAGTTTIILGDGLTYRLTNAGAGEDSAETGDLDVNAMIRIVGNDSTIDAVRLDRAFEVNADAELSLEGVSIRNGLVTDDSGGAIASAGTLTLSHVEISSSTADGEGASGGAVFNDGGMLVIHDSHLHGNTATRAGGAIEAAGGETHVTRSRLTGNSTGDNPGNGGALHITGEGDAVIDRSTVSHNTAGREGGGLWNSVGTMTVTNSQVFGNRADGAGSDDGGGGLFNDGGTLIVASSTVTANDAGGESGSGGGIFNNEGDLRVEHSAVTANAAARAGGGIETLGGTVELDQVELSRNSTGDNPGNGGGLHTSSAGNVTIDRSWIRGNDAANEGGGLWNSADCTMTVTRTTLEANEAPAGPDAFNVGGPFTIDGTPVPAG